MKSLPGKATLSVASGRSASLLCALPRDQMTASLCVLNGSSWRMLLWRYCPRGFTTDIKKRAERYEKGDNGEGATGLGNAEMEEEMF